MINVFIISSAVLLLAALFYAKYLTALIFIPRQILKAQKYFGLHDDKALKVLHSVIDIDRSNPQACWLLSRIYIKRKNYILAQVFLFDILKAQRYTRDITEEEVRLNLAGIYELTGDVQKALRELYHLKHYSLLPPEGYKKAINLNLNNKNFKEAVGLAAEALLIRPDDGEFHFLAAKAEFAHGNFIEAEKRLRKGVDTGYHSRDTDILLGKISFIEKKFDQAVKYFQNLPHESLSSSEIESMLGECFYHLKDYQSSIQILEKLLEETRSDQSMQTDVQYLLGCAYEMAGRVEEAIALWEKISLRFPLHRNIREKLLFYHNIAPASWMRSLIGLPLVSFIGLTEKLLAKFDFFIKQLVYEDEKNLEYLCGSKSDVHLFSLYFISVTRQTSPLSREFIKQRMGLRHAHRAKYLVLIAPHFSDDLRLFAQKNCILLYDFSEYKSLE
ncbi:MAG: hypothetical protein A2096_10660 [Spirochaetes bacterium GWF1_41_5]|nr:MAG: hypothetical protein A2096_10660 [Spirochaetes bacterium GWF1_41_5]